MPLRDGGVRPEFLNDIVAPEEIVAADMGSERGRNKSAERRIFFLIGYDSNFHFSSFHCPLAFSGSSLPEPTLRVQPKSAFSLIHKGEDFYSPPSHGGQEAQEFVSEQEISRVQPLWFRYNIFSKHVKRILIFFSFFFK
jgi:hypothetical protein